MREPGGDHAIFEHRQKSRERSGVSGFQSWNIGQVLHLYPKLDFIHLNINKKQGKLRQTLDQEVANANPACRIYHDTWSLCEAVLEAHLGTCQNIADWCNPLSC